MTSSVLAGEKRWASARRSGMTVLGKVAVPKPLNLPSQRSENHGLDPNVEIVPKGTLSWGNRSLSSSSSAWGSSTLSPNADCGANSPTHVSGRPSSGGSGTRPSTASSDRMHEPTTNAWGPNSRPSSASGSLTSSQTSLTSLRPRSAETRPCSSQLSRFAEPSSDNSIAWGPSGTAQKLGAASSNRDEFSLSSGDFPTLGSEKDNSRKNPESQDHGSHLCPSSYSGTVVPAKERAVTSQADQKSGNVDTWKGEGPQNIEDGVQRRVENWQGDSQQYLNANVPPQPFDVWRGHPVNAPPGVWYRGPPGCPPYGAPVAPGGFPIEPFPYYRPQIPPNLAHSQSVPPMGPGPRGHHVKNDDSYRPPMPEAYIRPGMPIRPGFYPGPMAYEGYYGPPIGYCNSSERDFPFMGMTAGPSVYNRFPTHNAPHLSNIHSGAGGHGSMAKASVSEQVKSNHSDDSQGQYKVLQKQQNHWDWKEEEENLKHAEPINALCVGEGYETGTTSRKNELSADDRRDEMYARGASHPIDHSRHDEMYSRRTPSEFSQTTDNQGGNALDSVKAIAKDSMANTKVVDDSWTKRSESVASTFPQGPKVVATSPKDSTLIRKIEGLNAKARASEGRHDVVFTSSREEQKKQVQVSHRDNNSTNDAGAVAVCLNVIHAVGNPVPGFHDLDVCTADKSSQPAAASGMIISRRAHHGVQGRVDHRSKGRFNTENADGWRKRSVAVESSTAVSAVNFEPSTDCDAWDHNPSKEVAVKSLIDLPVKVEGEFLTPNLDSSDGQAQRAKMRELARQRALQLQKEEEERTREQKAKASAKLEELNRRSQVGDGSTQKVEEALPGGGIQWRQEESVTHAEHAVVATKCEAPSSALAPHINVAVSSETSSSEVGESTVIPKESLCGTPKNAQHEVLDAHVQSLSSEQEVHKTDSRTDDEVAQFNDKSNPRYKRMGYKQQQNVLPENNLAGKLAPINTNEASRNNGDALVNDSAITQVVPSEVVSGAVSRLPDNSNIMANSLAHQHQRRKNNRNGRNKPRMDDASLSTLPLTVMKETHSAEPSTENPKPVVSPLELDPSWGQSVTDAKDGVERMEQHLSLPTEEAHGRETNQWKSQRSRRMPRNLQANRFADKFHNSDIVVWAPVRSQNKAEVMCEAVDKTVPDAVSPDSKNDNVMQSSLRSKRAEMKRYIPKPVAKELAQQGCILQPSSSSLSQAISDEPCGRVEPGVQSAESRQPDSTAIGNAGSAAESRNGYNKQSKQLKAHGAWRQRGSTDSPLVQGLQHETSFTSEPKNNVLKFVDQQQSLKPDSNLAKDGLRCSDRGSTSDDWNTPNNVDVAAPVVKDQGFMGKGKRHAFKGHRNTGNNQDDCENVNSVEVDKSSLQFGILEMSQIERTVASKEHRGTGEGTLCRWQPKSQINNQQGIRSAVIRNITAEVARDSKKDPHFLTGLHVPPQHDGEGGKAIAQPHSDQTVLEYKNIEEAPNLGHQEGARDRRTATSQRRPYSPIQGAVSVDDPAPFDRKATSSRRRPSSPSQGPVSTEETACLENMNVQREQHVSPEFHKNGNRNNRPSRGHESRGDWSSSRQDNRQHRMPANRERHRQSSHYEYQPVGLEGPDGSESHNMMSRYRERGQGHSRRGGGNFHGRQSRTVQVDSGYG